MVQAFEPKMGHRDLPQALILLNEMNLSAQHVASLVDNVLKKVGKGELTTNEGLSFLEVKYNMLLSYLINLTYVVLRKCSGEQIEDDPCLDRLIELRTFLEKIRPIDHKLKYQIDKLVKTAVNGTNNDDPTSYKANLANMIVENNDNNTDEESDDDDDDDVNNSDKEKTTSVNNNKTNIYVPPKLAAVQYKDGNAIERAKKLEEKNKKMQLSSSIMQDLREEYLDTPIEISQGNRAQQILSKEQKEREDYEEEYLTRLPITKGEKHRKRKLTTMGTLGDEITSFSASSGRKRKQKSFKKGKNPKRRRFN